MLDRCLAPLALPWFLLACGGAAGGAVGEDDGGVEAGASPRTDAAQVGADASAPDAGGRDWACSGGADALGDLDAGVDLAGGDVVAGELCARLAAVLCAGEASCCETAGHDRATCEAAQFEVCATEWLLDAVSLDPRSGFDEERAVEALERIACLSAACDPRVSEYNLSIEGLWGAFRGSRPLGASCNLMGGVVGAAASLVSCAPADTTACLTFGDSVRSSEWTCAPKGGLGAPCFTHLNCHEGLSCSNASTTLSIYAEFGTCIARARAGVPCNANGECASLYCVEGACARADDVQAAYCLARQIQVPDRAL